MFSQKVASIEGETDLIILPEMFSTGFSMNTALAEEQNGSAIEWMKKTAAEKNCVVVGSLLISERKKYFNRLIWMRPDGESLAYDKRHLFSLSDEPNVFSSGK